MIKILCRSEQETQELAKKISAHLIPSDIILLSGSLGAGKTTFVQGLCKSLGVKANVLSPTFTIAHHYDGVLNQAAIKIHHLDLYRLDEPNSAKELEYELEPLFRELLASESADGTAIGGIMIVEWAERLASILPKEFLEIIFTFQSPTEPNHRTLELNPMGESWLKRREGLETLAQSTNSKWN